MFRRKILPPSAGHGGRMLLKNVDIQLRHYRMPRQYQPSLPRFLHISWTLLSTACIKSSSWLEPFNLFGSRYFSLFQIIKKSSKKYEMSQTCSTRGRGEKCMYDFGPKPHRQTDHLGNLSVDGRIILNAIVKEVWESMDLIHVTQGRDQCPLSTLNECTALIVLTYLVDNTRMLWTRGWTAWLRTMRVTFWPPEGLLASPRSQLTETVCTYKRV
jgi:hypothetical protein